MQVASVTSSDNGDLISPDSTSNSLWYVLLAIIVFAIFWIVYTKNKRSAEMEEQSKPSNTGLIAILVAIAILVGLFFYNR